MAKKPKLPKVSTPSTPFFKVTGIKEIEELLGEIAPKKAQALNRNTNLAIARRIGLKIKELMPKNKRRTGAMEEGVKWRRRRGKPNKPLSIVYMAKSKKSGEVPFYWRFLNNGRGGKNPMSGLFFVERSVEVIKNDFDSIYKEEFTKKLQKMIKSAKKKIAKK